MNAAKLTPSQRAALVALQLGPGDSFVVLRRLPSERKSLPATTRVLATLERAGLVAIVPSLRGLDQWSLTDAGREALAASEAT